MRGRNLRLRFFIHLPQTNTQKPQNHRDPFSPRVKLTSSGDSRGRGGGSQSGRGLSLFCVLLNLLFSRMLTFSTPTPTPRSSLPGSRTGGPSVSEICLRPVYLNLSYGHIINNDTHSHLSSHDLLLSHQLLGAGRLSLTAGQFGSVQSGSVNNPGTTIDHRCHSTSRDWMSLTQTVSYVTQRNWLKFFANLERLE